MVFDNPVLNTFRLPLEMVLNKYSIDIITYYEQNT